MLTQSGLTLWIPGRAWLTPANSLKIIEESCILPTNYLTAKNSKGYYKNFIKILGYQAKTIPEASDQKNIGACPESTPE